MFRMRIPKMKLVLALVLTLLVAGASSASAVSAPEAPPLNADVYLKLDSVKGESRARGFENWIQLTDVSFGLSAEQAPAAAGAGSRLAKASLTPLSVKKKWDASSIPIFQAAASGTLFKQAQIVFVRKGEGQTPYLTIDLGSVGVSSYEYANDAESLGLVFESIQFSYASTNAAGMPNPPQKGGWNVRTNTRL